MGGGRQRNVVVPVRRMRAYSCAIATSLSLPLFALKRGVAQTDRGLDAVARAGSGRQEAG